MSWEVNTEQPDERMTGDVGIGPGLHVDTLWPRKPDKHSSKHAGCSVLLEHAGVLQAVLGSVGWMVCFQDPGIPSRITQWDVWEGERWLYIWTQHFLMASNYANVFIMKLRSTGLCFHLVQISHQIWRRWLLNPTSKADGQQIMNYSNREQLTEANIKDGHIQKQPRMIWNE